MVEIVAIRRSAGRTWTSAEAGNGRTIGRILFGGFVFREKRGHRSQRPLHRLGLRLGRCRSVRNVPRGLPSP